MASTIGPSRANTQWNKKKKGDGDAAVRRSNINESNGISGRASNEGDVNRNGNRKRERHTVGENSIAKGSNGAGLSAGRKSNKSGNNNTNSTEINGKALDKGSMHTNGKKKGEGHTTGNRKVQQLKNKKKRKIGKGHKERKENKNRIKYGIQKT